MRTLESDIGASRLLLDLIPRRRRGQRQQRRRERDQCNGECDLKRRSADGTIFCFSWEFFFSPFLYKGKKPEAFQKK